MVFNTAPAPSLAQNNVVLSADNSLPERHIIMDTLRTAAPRLGLTASVIATLDAMLSCLAPKRNHHTVFASNATLTFRRNGISDRTLRRHAATLQEVGLLTRHDSPNGKRFTRHNRAEGKVMRFGFDLSPLFQRLREICALATEVEREQEQIAYMRCKIRAQLSNLLKANPHDSYALDVLRRLRRKLTLKDCEMLLDQCDTNCVKEANTETSQHAETDDVTGKDGQSVRHYHSSNKELIDKSDGSSVDAPLSVHELLAACPEAKQFALNRVETSQDVIAHGRSLAPMIGINAQSYDAAQQRLGAFRTAATVWALMQFHGNIKAVGAYFRSITTGAKSSGFSPEKLVRRLDRLQARVA